MAEQESITAVFEAIDNISDTLNQISTSLQGTSNRLENLKDEMEEAGPVSQGYEVTIKSLAREINGISRKLSEAERKFESFTGAMNVSAASATNMSVAMDIAEKKIDEAGDEALTTAGQMGVLDTVMSELALSGSALSVNIGAFNVSLRNLAPLIPIAASMGTVVSVLGAFIAALGEATVALAAFATGGAIAFVQDLQDEFEGLTDQAETMEAVMGGLKDLFIDAFDPLISESSQEFFIDLVEGAAELTNRFAQAVSQMEDLFFGFFGGVADIINREFDSIATAIRDTFAEMEPVVLSVIEWFMEGLPEALRFVSKVTRELAGPIGNLGNSLLDVLRSIIEVTVSVVQGLAPAFSAAADLVTSLIDAFEVLSNGILQFTLFIGGAALAATKFVGIADTMANIALTASNRWIQFGKNASSSITGFGQSLVSSAQESFKHLRALGMVLTRNMSISQASGQVHRDRADQIQETAKKVERLREEYEDLKQEYIEFIATAEAAGPGDAMAIDMDKLDDQLEQVNNRFSNFDAAGAETETPMTDEVLPVPADTGDSMDGAEEAVEESSAGMRQHLGTLREKTRAAGSAIKGSLMGLGGAFIQFSNNVSQKMQNFVSFIGTGIFNTMKGAFGSMSNLVGSAATTIGQQLTKLSTFGFKAAMSIGQSIGSLRGTFSGLNATIESGEKGLSALSFGMQKTSENSLVLASSQLKAAASSKVTTLQLWRQKMATDGVTTSLRAMAASLWSSVKGLAATAAGAVSAAVTFIGTLLPSISTVGTALNVAFAGIPALLGAIAIGAGVVVGVIGNMDAITSGARDTFQGLKRAAKELGGILIDVGVPAWNAMVDALEAVMAPVFAVFDGLKMVGRALGIVSKSGKGTGGVVSTLIGLFGKLMSMVGGFFNFVAPIFTFIGNLLYKSFILPFKISAFVISNLIHIITTLGKRFIQAIPGASALINRLVNGFNTVKNAIFGLPEAAESVAQSIAQTFDDIINWLINNVVQPFINLVNEVIRKANQVLDLNIDTVEIGSEEVDVSSAFEGAQTSGEEVRENVRSMSDEQDQDDVATDPDVNMNFEDSVEQNIDVQADPEEKEQMRRIVKDAMNEANSIARRQEGVGR